MMYTSSRSSPGGCILAVLGFIPAAFGVAGIFGLAKWIALPPDQQVFDAVFWCVVGAFLVGWSLAVVIWFISYRAIKRADFRNYDSRDPDQTGLKW